MSGKEKITLESLIARHLSCNRLCGLKFVSDIDVLIHSLDLISKKNTRASPGIDNLTLEGLNLNILKDLSNSLGSGSYKPMPSVRKYIPKPDGRKKPLGIPSYRDKIVQQAILLGLEYSLEPIFLDTSHGFRTGRNCHTAVKYFQRRFSSIR